MTSFRSLSVRAVEIRGREGERRSAMHGTALVRSFWRWPRAGSQAASLRPRERCMVGELDLARAMLAIKTRC